MQEDTMKKIKVGILVVPILLLIVNCNNFGKLPEKTEQTDSLRNPRFTMNISKGFDVRKLRWGMTIEEIIKADSFPKVKSSKYIPGAFKFRRLLTKNGITLTNYPYYL